jgi:uncharacterized protein HemY
VATEILAARQVAPELAGIALDWLRAALRLRADELSERITEALPGSRAERRSVYAALALEAGQTDEALAAALEHTECPDSLEVLGLVALRRGFYEEAALALEDRARRADPKVSVLLGASEALHRVGQADRARALLAERGEQRRWSKAIREACVGGLA